MWTGYRSSTQQSVQGNAMLPAPTSSQLSQFRILPGLHHGSIRDLAKSRRLQYEAYQKRSTIFGSATRIGLRYMLFLFRSADRVPELWDGVAGKRAANRALELQTITKALEKSIELGMVMPFYSNRTTR